VDLTPIREKADHMPQEKPEPDRIRELEDALKEAERRVAEMRAERDQAFELVEQMKEHVSDVDALIDSWIEEFEIQLSQYGTRTHDALPESIKKILADAVALQKRAKGLGKR
jgi:predicted  nucleic acid-binding Zn-ribbon protein